MCESAKTGERVTRKLEMETRSTLGTDIREENSGPPFEKATWTVVEIKGRMGYRWLVAEVSTR